MESIEREPIGAARWSCAGCGEVIGVYEPLMHVVDSIAYRTSRAADPDLGGRKGLFYHAACSHLAGGEIVSGEHGG